MVEDGVRQVLDAYVDEVWEDVVRDIDHLVQVESVEDLEHVEPGKPWGPAPYEAMSRALGIAERLGLEAHDCEGYIGFADVPGKSDRYLATIAHSDIVPLGSNWTFDPLRVTRRDGYLIGRGVLDDKGPLVLSLYAAHFFKRMVDRTGAPLPLTLRAIVGANEETNMKDVEYYLAHYPQPEFCFSPDADFPLICGEKGHVNLFLTSSELGDDARIVSFDGGTVMNAIPGEAVVVVRGDVADVPRADGIEVFPESEGLVRIVAHGKGGHASLPEGTRNAIGMLVEHLLENGIFNPAEREFLLLLRLVFASTDGSSLGIAANDGLFDPLTSIGGTIHMVDGRLVQTMDIRYPTNTTSDLLAERVGAIARGHNATLEVAHDMKPFYMDPSSDEVQTLLGAYNDLNGSSDEAFTIGGGTYSRHFARAVAFGPHDSRVVDPDWVGPEHGADEGMSEEQLRLGLKVYILAIARLMGVEIA